MSNKKAITIETFVVIARLSDGSYRQIIIEDKTRKAILSLIDSMEDRINILETKLEGIEF